MPSKNYFVNWHFKDAFVDFSELKAEEIGVLMQINNLIYSKGGPVDKDPKYLGKICNIQKTKCERIINSLIHKGRIYITEDGKISQARCELELEGITKRRKKSVENGKKGAEKRWPNEGFQEDSDSQTMNGAMAKTNTKNNNNTNTTPLPPTTPGNRDVGKPAKGLQGGYNIDHHLTDQGRDAARQNAPGWDMQHLMREYNQWVHSKGIPHSPNSAFPAWCLRRTGGVPPP